MSDRLLEIESSVETLRPLLRGQELLHCSLFVALADGESGKSYDSVQSMPILLYPPFPWILQCLRHFLVTPLVILARISSRSRS